jgi:hypothetical protein
MIGRYFYHLLSSQLAAWVCKPWIIDMGLEYHFNYMVDGNALLPLTDLEKRVCEVAVCDRCFDEFQERVG